MPTDILLRVATGADVPVAVRFGALMFQSMGETDMRWVPHAEEVLRAGIAEGRMRAVVAEDTGTGAIVSGAVGVLWDRLPSPNNHLGRGGYVQYVWTEPDFRGRGLARSVLEDLIAWFRECGVANIDLHATAIGQSIYRGLGFAETEEPALRLYL